MKQTSNDDNVTRDIVQFGRIQREIRQRAFENPSVEAKRQQMDDDVAFKTHNFQMPHGSRHQAAEANFLSTISTRPDSQSMGMQWTGEITPPCGGDDREYFLETSLSCKLFLGGVSWYTSDNDIVQRFVPYGLRNLELPSRFQQQVGGSGRHALAVASLGFAYLIFENGQWVRQLLEDCTCRRVKMPSAHGDLSSSMTGNQMRRDCLGKLAFYIDLPSSHGNKPVEVIPWALSDNNYFRAGVVPPLDPKRTVFIGNLHGTVKANELAYLIEQIFKCSVEYAGIDVDKYKYPIGSGRVTFQRGADYNAAINTAFVDVRTSRFQKRIQIDPYLEDVRL